MSEGAALIPTEIYRVAVNHKEQYSIWPDYKPLPSGWRDAQSR